MHIVHTLTGSSGDLNSSINFSISASAAGNSLLAKVVITDGGSVNGDGSGISAPAGWIEESKSNYGGTWFLIYSRTATADANDALAITFDDPCRVMCVVDEVDAALTSVNVALRGTQNVYSGFTGPASAALTTVSVLRPTATQELLGSQNDFLAVLGEYGTGQNDDPEIATLWRQTAADESVAENVFFDAAAQTAVVTAQYEGAIGGAPLPAISTSPASITEGEAVDVVFDADLPATFTIENTTHGMSIPFTRPASNTVRFTISDNAVPGQNLTLSFEVDGSQFAEFTAQYDLESGWLYIERLATAPSIDDEIAVGDFVLWDNPKFVLTPTADHFEIADGATLNSIEFIRYRTINVASSAAYSNIATISIVDNNGVPTQNSTIPDINITSGTAVNHDLLQYFDDPDGDVLLVTSDALPTGATIDNGVLNWSNPDQVGQFTIPLSIDDGEHELLAQIVVSVFPGVVPNPVFDIPIEIEGVPAPENTLVRVHAFEAGSLTNLVLSPAAYSTGSNGRVLVDVDVLDLQQAYDVYMRLDSNEVGGHYFKNVSPTDANA